MVRRYDREFKLKAIRSASEPNNTASEVEWSLGSSQGCLSLRDESFVKMETTPFLVKAACLPMRRN